MAACSSAVPAKLAKVLPPFQPPIQRYVEPLSMPIPVQIQEYKEPIDPVALIIVEAELRFERGEELYQQGFLRQAKAEFHGAMDLLLKSTGIYPNDSRLEREISELVSRIHALELATIRESDAFTDQNAEHAVIDDLKNVETFPDAVDPKLKQEVENEVKEITHDLPIEINDRVLGFLNHYQNGRGRATIEAGFERVGRYQPMIEQILKEEGVPQDLIYLCQAESAFKPRAVSRARAKGMWQFISSRGKEYGLRQTWWVDERSDPEKSTRAAARHLKDLYQQFGDWYLAMAAYNAGPVRVQRAMAKTGADNFWTLAKKRALPKETINYVPNILALTIIGKNPEKYGFNVESAPPLATERVNVDKATDLRVIAETISLPLEYLRELNPHVLRWTTPPDDREFELILPKGYSEKFTAQIASLPESQRLLFREHVVRKGDTLGAIAKKYSSTVTELRQVNNLQNKTLLRVGQSLIIPMSGVSPTAVGVREAQARQRAASIREAQARQRAASIDDSPGARRSASPIARNLESGAPLQTATASYTVRRGDTLSEIAARFDVSVQKLKAWNHLSSTHLTIGKKLVVTDQPVAAVADNSTSRQVVHRVRAGETLDEIATTYKTSVDAILSWNKKNDLSVIYPGDQITIFLGESR